MNAALRMKAGMMFLERAIINLQDAKECILKALPRCQNCGKVMDQSVCPFCGFVQL